MTSRFTKWVVYEAPLTQDQRLSHAFDLDITGSQNREHVKSGRSLDEIEESVDTFGSIDAVFYFSRR